MIDSYEWISIVALVAMVAIGAAIYFIAARHD